MKYLRDVVPNEDELSYLLKTISLSLIGNNKLEEFYVWIGEGRNGKEFIRHLMMGALGHYFGIMPVENVLESDNKYTNSNALDDIMYSNRKCRCVVVSEAPKNAKLACDKIKAWSGRDPVKARTLNKQLITFIPPFTVYLQTNEEFDLNGGEVAIRKHFKCFKFQYIFTENPTKQNEKQVDEKLEDLITSEPCKLAFIEILITHYQDFVKNNSKLIVPPRIKKDTEDYLNEHDRISLFIKNRLEKTNNDNDTIKASELYESFMESLDQTEKTKWSQPNFKNSILNKGIRWKKTKKANVYMGIKFFEIGNN